MGNTWDVIKTKRCEVCLKELPKKKRWKGGKLEKPSEYRRRKYCNMSCAVSGSWRRRTDIPYLAKKNPKISIPSRVVLNQMFSRLRSYKAMADELGVSRHTVGRWMGSKKNLENPKY